MEEHQSTKHSVSEPSTLATRTLQGHSSDENESTYFRLMDLPAEIRLNIFSYVFGDQFFFITSPNLITEETPPGYWWRWCACRHVLRSLNRKRDQPLEPWCVCAEEYRDPDDGHDDETRMSLLSVSKQVRSESKDILSKENVIAFNHPADLDSVLLTEDPGRAKRANLTRLEITICPRSLETHELQLRVRGKMPYSASNGGLGWGSMVWIFAFRYLSLENLARVSVDSTELAFVFPAEDEEENMKKIELSKDEQKEYETQVQEFLLQEYEPGEQDDIELMWVSYTKHVHNLGFTEDIE
ncbi:hypothetical protein N0V90_006092 [Kalmusia sp. IMI 367209]|nr:hypothetical protein N0V90_006092 [Kalmusia sp. IMI 367209]